MAMTDNVIAAGTCLDRVTTGTVPRHLMIRACKLAGATLFCLVSLHADHALAQGTKYAGEFLRIGVGPRALGMGGAFVAVADDVTAAYWNPAGLAFLANQVASVMHSEQLSGLAYDYAAYAHPRGDSERRTAYGVSLIRLGLDDIPITSLPNPSLPIDELLADGQRNRPFIVRFVGNVEYGLLLSYARKASSRLAIGGNLKLIHKSLGVASAFGIGVDAGVLFSPISRLFVGANLQNVTSTILTWDTGTKEYIAPLLKLGVSYLLPVNKIHGQILFAADVDILIEGRKQSATSLGRASGSGHFGVEYNLQQTVALRTGVNGNGITAGAGIRTPAFLMFSKRLTPSIDYAFVNDSAFGAVHRVGASVGF